ncbi:MAG: PilN domain-containing protein [Phycisphaerales bacterium]|nr:PilN domain-containing protein [Phycisphaerales bacterium]
MKGAQGKRSDSSFLPEDYLKKKAERRTNSIAVVLFVVVTFGVVGAFFVTNRQWHDVRQYQKSVNVRFAKAAEDIERLKALEEQGDQLQEKAELTMVLIEKVPRTRLLAELINRMPKEMKLMELEVQSERLDKPLSLKRAKRKAAQPDKGSSLTKKQRTGKGPKEKSDEPPPVMAPRYDTSVVILGVAPHNTEVARYLSGLQACDLLTDVELVSTEKTTIKERELVKFRIEAELRPGVDARSVEPLKARREGDPFRLDTDEPAAPSVDVGKVDLWEGKR